jgi:hypothetical protein
MLSAGTYGVNSIVLGWAATVCSQTLEKKAVTIAMMTSYVHSLTSKWSFLLTFPIDVHQNIECILYLHAIPLPSSRFASIYASNAVDGRFLGSLRGLRLGYEGCACEAEQNLARERITYQISLLNKDTEIKSLLAIRQA